MWVKRVRFPLVGLVVGLTLGAGLSGGVSEAGTLPGLGGIKEVSSKPSLPEPAAWLPSGPWIQEKGGSAGEDGQAGGMAGYLPGGGNVSGMGQYQYSIPLEVPDGRAGMQPTLSLQYSGGVVNGPVGIGWSIAGAMSAITRCGKSFMTEGYRGGVNYQDVTTGGTDRFCLDGQKLVSVSGVYGGNGTEYRTAQESFAQIFSYVAQTGAGVAPDKFVVKSKEGLISTYLPISGRRYEGHADGMVSNSNGTNVGPRRVMWLLDTVEDR